METLIHLFIPRESNNHKAKILHPSSIIVVASFLILFQGLIKYIPKVNPNILGYASSISKTEVVRLTNEKRAQAGLGALTLNENLSNAAYTKGSDMINRDYWAHTAPDGTEPWAFFSGVGYKYRFAGENLARDFSNANDAVNAWMNSPTHRDNILNSKYKEIGIGIIDGNLAGSDTTLIVQFFGATYADNVAKPLAAITTTIEKPNTQATPIPLPSATPIAEQIVIKKPLNEVQAAITTPAPNQQVLISPFTTTKSFSLIVVGILLLVFLLDVFLVSRRKITRVAGRTFAHIIFLGMILTIIIMLKSGNII